MEIIPYLRKFQHDLLTDRKEQHTDPAAPIYYGILDFKAMPAPAGEFDRIIIFNTDTQKSVTLEEYFQNWDEDEKARLCDHEDAGIIRSDDDDNNFELDDPMAYARYLDEYEDIGAYGDMLMYEYDLDYVVRNALFFTKADAEQYLHDNSQHYTEKACVIAMRAIRYPRYEQLLQLFLDLDLDKSRLVFHHFDEADAKPFGIDWNNSHITHTSEVDRHDI